MPAIEGLAEAAQEFGRKVGEAIRSIDWIRVIRDALGSSTDIGTTVGQWIRNGISNMSLADVVDNAKLAAIAAMIVAGLLAALFLLPVVLIGGLALVVGSALVGLAEGILGMDFSQIATNIWDGIKNAVDAVGDWLTMLVAKGVDLLAGLVTGINTGWLAVQAWLLLLPALIVATVGDVSSTLKQKGLDLLTGLQNGILNGWTTVSNWMGYLGTRIFLAIGDLAMTIYSKGKDLITGFDSGIKQTYFTVKLWLEGLGARAVTAVGNLGSRLYQAGKDLIQGLINGIEDMIPGLNTAVNAINSVINLIDRGSSPWPMFIESGQDLMKGLVIGTQRGMPALERQVGRINTEIDGIGGSASAGGVGAGQVIQIITLEPGRWKEFLDNAMAGGEFAKGFGRELGMYAGQP